MKGHLVPQRFNAKINKCDRVIMSHIVNECPLTKFPGGIQVLYTADEDAINWFYKFSIC